MCLIPTFNCVDQIEQQKTQRQISESGRRTYSINTQKFVGVGKPASFSLSFNVSGYTTQIAQCFRSILCDINISGNYSGIDCTNETDVDQKSEFYNIYSDILFNYRILGSYHITLVRRLSKGKGYNKLSENKIYDMVDGALMHSERLYYPRPPSGCLILKMSVSANNHNYNMYIQSFGELDEEYLKLLEEQKYEESDKQQNDQLDKLYGDKKEIINKYKE